MSEFYQLHQSEMYDVYQYSSLNEFLSQCKNRIFYILNSKLSSGKTESPPHLELAYYHIVKRSSRHYRYQRVKYELELRHVIIDLHHNENHNEWLNLCKEQPQLDVKTKLKIISKL